MEKKKKKKKTVKLQDNVTTTHNKPLHRMITYDFNVIGSGGKHGQFIAH